MLISEREYTVNTGYRNKSVNGYQNIKHNVNIDNNQFNVKKTAIDLIIQSTLLYVLASHYKIFLE